MTNPTPCEGILFGFVVPIPAFPGYVLLNKVPTEVVPTPMIVVTTPTQEYIAETTFEQELILVLDSIPLSIDLFITLQKGRYKINIKNEVTNSMKVKKNFFCIKKKIISNIDDIYEF